MKKLHSNFHCLILMLLLTTLSISQDIQNCDYAQFLKSCGRNNQINLDSEAYKGKSKYFQQQCQEQKKQNQKTGEWKMSLQCKTTDATEAQLSSRIGLSSINTDNIVRSTYNPNSNQPGKVSATVLPTSYNYVSLGQVTSVKNQGTCGCCWSFASIAMYESLLLKRGLSYGLSEQASLQCTSYYSPGNRVSDCSGGYFIDPLTFLGKVGAVLRSNYPYISGSYGSGAGYPKTQGICSQASRISIGNGTAAIYGPLTVTQVKTMLIEYGPVMVGVYANYAFTQYSSGVFTGCPVDAANYINHAVLLVGYDDSTNSWLIKNQWDSEWGQSGYIRISYTRDCGLSTLIGRVQFSNYNSNPSITITDKTLLFSSSKWQGKTILSFVVLLFIMGILFQ